MAEKAITIENLRKSGSKPGMNDCLFRKVSYYMTVPILHTKLTPTDITWVWIVLGIGSTVFFLFGNYWFSLMGTALLCFAFLFDHIDGTMARFRKQYSDSGYFLDEMGSHIMISMLLLFIGIGGWQKTGSFLWLFLGIYCLFLYLYYQVLQLISTAKTNKGLRTGAANKHPKFYKKYQTIANLLRGHFDEICYILIVLAIIGIAEWILIYFALVYTGLNAGKTTYDYLYSFKT